MLSLLCIFLDNFIERRTGGHRGHDWGVGLFFFAALPMRRPLALLPIKNKKTCDEKF